MNNNTDNEIDYALIGRYLSSEATPAEAIELEKWLSASPSNRQLFEEISNLFWSLSPEEQFVLPNKADFFQQLKGSIPAPHQTQVYKLKKNRLWLSIAASILIIASIAVLFTIFSKNRSQNNIPFVSLRTEQMILHDTLPDESVVIVNSHSFLKYPSVFNEKQRNIHLEGEAWFSVTPNANMPFIIETGPIKVKVIGTSFNLSNRTNSIEVAVKSGAVRMISNVDSITIQAGQKGIYNTATNIFSVLSSFNPNEIAYATRVFNFENTTLKEIVSHLEKAYGISVVFQNKKIMGCTMSSSFENKPIEYIFDVIAMTLNIQYQIKNKTVYISGNNCT